MPFSSAPGFIIIQYSSPKSIHTMRIGTRAWVEPAGGNVYGSYLDWDDTPVAADSMIDSLITALVAAYPDTHNFINATIYTQASPSADALPRMTYPINEPGTIATPDWWEAVQGTFNFRDTDFTSMKLTLLDCDSENLFGKLVAVSAVARWDAIADAITNTGAAWSSRNGFQPVTVLSFTRTLNEKLRRAYGHTG